MSRTTSRCAAAVLAAAFLVPVLATATASAAPSRPVAAASSAQADQQPQGKLLLMLDASGSMKEPDASGQTKMAAAKKALTSVVTGLPDDARVGLRVYGATQPGGRPTKKACADTQLVHPISPLDRPGLRTAIRGVEAKGETPIAHSLAEAKKDLGASGKRSIVLVSDGEESCVPNPCPVVKKLVGAGIDLQIDTVGFGVDARARKQLQCIADVGHGSYYDARDADALTASLTKLSQRALRPFTVSGEPVTASARRNDAPSIEPGRYTDTYSVSQRPRYLKLRRTPGSVVHLSLVVRPSTQGRDMSDAESWAVTLTTPDGTSCDRDYDNAIEFFRSGSAMTVSVSANNRQAGEADKGSTTPDPCASSKQLIASVEHEKGGGGKLPVQFVYVEEPPVADVASLPAGLDPAAVKPFTAKTSGKPHTVVGGGGFADAPVLTRGTYHDTILPGEQVYYRVRVGFGQRAAFTADIAKTGAQPKLSSASSNLFTVDAWTPALYRITRSGGKPENRASLGFGTTSLSLSEFVPQVRYRNKTSLGNGYHYPALRQVSLPGYYYFAIGRSTVRDEGAKVPVTMRIHVAVDGKPGGQPVYADSAPRASAAPTATPTPSTASATPSTPVTTHSTAAGVEQAAGPTQESGDSSPLRWVLGGGLLALAAVVGAAWMVLSRRGAGSGSHSGQAPGQGEFR